MTRQTPVVDPIRAVLNSLLLAAFLVVSVLAKSELGGPDSIYNSVNVGLVVFFLLMNLRFEGTLLLAFAVPLAFLFLSVVANVASLQLGSYNSAIATALGYLLFTLKPPLLDQRLLRRLAIVGLAVGLALSVSVAVDRQMMDFTKEIANDNFNLNPNGAAIFFLECVILAIVLVQGTLGWALAVPFVLLTVTTGSRAGAISLVLVLLGYSLLARRSGTTQSGRGGERVRAIWIATMIGIVSLVAIQRIVPDAADFLLLRFQVNSSRADQWNAGLEGIGSLRAFLVGGGPATLGARTVDSSHSSYIEAIGNSGVLFLGSTLVALLVWLRRLVRAGCYNLLWILPTVLVHGVVETILFNGLSTLWLLLMVLGLALQSQAATAATISASLDAAIPPSRLSGYRRLVRDTR